MEHPRGPRTYKSRRERPCDLCRTRKVACRIDAAPPCALCRTQGVTCTFIQRPGKRKRPTPQENVVHAAGRGIYTGPNRYQHEERQETHAVGQDTSQESAEEASLQTSNSMSPTFSEQGARSLVPRTSSTSTPMAKIFAPCFPNKENQPSMSEVRPIGTSLESNSTMTARLAGDTSESNRYLLRYYSFDEKDECVLPHMTYRRMRLEESRDGLDHQDPPMVFMILKDRLAESAEPRIDQATLDSAQEEVANMFSDEQSVRLVKLFFRYVYPYFPILSRSWFLSSGVSIMSRIRSLPLSLLSSLYATALPFMLHDDLLVTTLAHSSPSRNNLYQISWMAINHELHAPRLATLQACLLLHQRGPTNQYLTATPFKASLMGWSVGLAQSLGLARDCSQWINLPMYERRVRTRLWWAVFVMDQFVSLQTGSPCLISSAEFDVPTPSPPPSFRTLPTSEIPDAHDTPNGCAHFFHLVNLSLILADIHESYFTIRATARTSHDLSLSLDLARPLRARLTEWRHASASDCPLVTSSPTTQKPRGSQELNGNASLDLAYLVATVTLFRALLRPLEHGPSLPRTNTNAQPISTNSQTPSDAGARAAIYAGALTCSREAVEFLENLVSISSMWNAFWHSWSQSNFAIVSTFLMHMLLLRRARRDQDESGKMETEVADLVSRWRWAMRMGGGSGGWGNALMSLGLLRVDGLMVLLEGGGDSGERA